MTDCKSPAHVHYRDAVDGLYIQARMAQKALDSVIDDAIAENPGNPTLADKQHRVDQVIERLTYAQRKYAEAEREVNRHFDRGCRNLVAAR